MRFQGRRRGVTADGQHPFAHPRRTTNCHPWRRLYVHVVGQALSYCALRTCGRALHLLMTRFVVETDADRHQLNDGYAVNFNGHVAGKTGGLNSCAGGREGGEERRVNGIHFDEITHVAQKDSSLDNVLC